MDQPFKNYVQEVSRHHFAVQYETSKKLFSGVSKFQKVEVVETLGHGRMLLNDDLVMVTERDEFIYHEMMAHVPLFVHPKPRKVLVIGGGDGGTAREVLRHASVERCVMVEIDEIVVNACREFLPVTSSQLNHPNMELIIDDGVKFMRESKEQFDVILIDSTDPIGPATPLFGEDFYKDVFARLAPQGIVVAQGESPFYEVPMQKKLLTVVQDIFPLRTYLNFSNLTYPGGLWSFLFASKGLHPLRDFSEERVQASGMNFRYYHSGIHRACFQLPQFMKDNLAGLIHLP
jgi:spermidine synthase